MSLLSSVGPLTAAAPFKDQVTDSLFQQDVFYGVATVCLLFVVTAIALIDSGLVRRKNLLDTWIQKLVGAFVAAAGMYFIGYAVWEIQYYQAFGIPNPISQALKDWWAFGSNSTTFSQNLDPAVTPEADVFQIFVAFFMAYAAVGGALLHSAGLERVKALPMYIICLVAGAVVIPIALYYTWGSTSPLTNRGVHDYIGDYSLYIVVGVWALIIAWRAGPRLGAFTKDSRTMGPVPHNFGMSALGVGILSFAAPFAFLGCGYWVAGSGYYGISLTSSGFGIVVMNIFNCFAGGIAAGAIISYRTKNPTMVLIGLAAGYISCGTSLDVGKPWQIFLVAFIGMFVVWGVYELLYKLRIDDKKIVPLALGGGVYGALAGGVVGNGDKTGGYFGLTGEYAAQHATINLGWQALGVVVIVAISVVSGLIVIIGLEKTIGLRVTDEQEIVGLDATYWEAPPSPYEDVVGAPEAHPLPNGRPEPAGELSPR